MNHWCLKIPRKHAYQFFIPSPSSSPLPLPRYDALLRLNNKYLVKDLHIHVILYIFSCSVRTARVNNCTL